VTLLEVLVTASAGAAAAHSVHVANAAYDVGRRRAGDRRTRADDDWSDYVDAEEARLDRESGNAPTS
jgi:hypothetical protein